MGTGYETFNLTVPDWVAWLFLAALALTYISIFAYQLWKSNRNYRNNNH